MMFRRTLPYTSRDRRNGSVLILWLGSYIPFPHHLSARTQQVVAEGHLSVRGYVFEIGVGGNDDSHVFVYPVGAF